MDENLREALTTRLLDALSGTVDKLLNETASLRPLHWSLDPSRPGLAVQGMATIAYADDEVRDGQVLGSPRMPECSGPSPYGSSAKRPGLTS
jgi:hypothetical protein